MFVTTLEIDGIDGGDVTIDNPGWDLVEAEIRALDGDSKDSLVLQASDGSYMGISGGSNDEYVVAGYLVDTGRFILASGQGTGETKYIPVCGDENPFVDFEVVTLDIVLDVAKTFFEFGERDKKYEWNERSAATK
jgi:hypothetical protein